MGKTYEIGPRTLFTPLETGDYLMRLMVVEDKIEEQGREFRSKGEPYVEWHFEVTVAGADPVERRISTNIPKTWSEKSPFVQIVTALGIVGSVNAIEEGAVIDPQLGLGKLCVGTFVKKPKSDGKGWTDSIVAYAPYTRPVRRPTVPQAQQNASIPPDLQAELDEAAIPF